MSLYNTMVIILERQHDDWSDLWYS
jgi:hypothetical protein